MRRLPIVLLWSCWAFAQQTISVPPIAAPGSLLKIFPVSATPDLSRTMLQFQPGGFGPYFGAQLVAWSQGTLLAVVPEDFVLGPANVLLSVNGVAFRPAFIDVRSAAIDLFSVSGLGSGPAVAQNVDANGTASVNQLTHPALAGQYVTLWGTGLGKFTTADVTVELAGILIQPTYAGPAPGQPGVNQVNFKVPPDARDGCYIPVTVRAGRSISNEVTIAKAASPGACAHRFGLSSDQLATIDAGGTIPFGSTSIASFLEPIFPFGAPGVPRAVAGYVRFENAVADFRGANDLRLFALSQPQQLDGRYFSCGFNLPRLTLTSIRLEQYDRPPLTLAGPSNRQLILQELPAPNVAVYTFNAGNS
jgi:uncharacterized protein (TIGR03437 family)